MFEEKHCNPATSTQKSSYYNKPKLVTQDVLRLLLGKFYLLIWYQYVKTGELMN